MVGHLGRYIGFLALANGAADMDGLMFVNLEVLDEEKHVERLIQSQKDKYCMLLLSVDPGFYRYNNSHMFCDEVEAKLGTRRTNRRGMEKKRVME